jgi:hypothetical protein
MSLFKFCLLIFVCLGGGLSVNAIVLPTHASAEEARPTPGLSPYFSKDEQEELFRRIAEYRQDAQFYVNLNWRSDVGLKWAILLLSAMITIFAALAKTDAYKDKKWIGVALIVFGAGSTLVSAATSQFSFSTVKIVYQAKVNALDTFADDLRFRTPERDYFLNTLKIVRSWDSGTKVEDARLPEPRSHEVSIVSVT